MNLDDDIFLVKLPKVNNNHYYAIGYYTNQGFNFIVITKDLMKIPKPIRALLFSKEDGLPQDFQILGKIKDFPEPKDL